MRTAIVSVILLWLASSLAGSAAEPLPPSTTAPATAAPGTPGTAPATVPATAPATAHPPAAASEPASEPDRIDPTEKVHSDAEISFPVDI